MKTLEQIQEENRKAIILTNNPEAKSYKEALEKEKENLDEIFCGHCGNFTDGWTEYWEGKPLTLDRVLICIRKTNHNIKFVGGDYTNEMIFVLYDWDLTKPTLEEQVEETQRRINELLNNKENND